MASVFVIGAGGLGCAAIAHLAASGIARLGVADFDRVEISNLPRQLLYDESDIGLNKVDVVKRKIAALPGGGSIQVDAHREVVRGNEGYLSDYDVIIDGTDRGETKLALHDELIRCRKPFVHAAASGWSAQGLLVDGPGCLRCLFGDAPDIDPPDCRRAGILGPVVGLAGHLAAAEAMKHLSGHEPAWRRRLWKLDALGGTSKSIPFEPDPNCPLECFQWR